MIDRIYACLGLPVFVVLGVWHLPAGRHRHRCMVLSSCCLTLRSVSGEIHYSLPEQQ